MLSLLKAKSATTFLLGALLGVAAGASLTVTVIITGDNSPVRRTPLNETYTCQDGWRQHNGLAAVFLSPENDREGKSYVTCSRNGYEISVWEDGKVTGFDPQGYELQNPEDYLDD